MNSSFVGCATFGWMDDACVLKMLAGRHTVSSSDFIHDVFT